MSVTLSAVYQLSISIVVSALLTYLNWERVKPLLDKPNKQLGLGIMYGFLGVSILWGITSFSSQGTWLSQLVDSLFTVILGVMVFGLLLKISYTPAPPTLVIPEEPPPPPPPPEPDTSIEDKIEELLKQNRS